MMSVPSFSRNILHPSSPPSQTSRPTPSYTEASEAVSTHSLTAPASLSSTEAFAPPPPVSVPSPFQKSIKRKAPKKKTLKDPSAPKRPQTSFLHFSGEERPKVIAELGNISVGQVSKEIGRRWAELDKDKIEKYEVASAKAKARYLNDMKNYQPSKQFLEKKAEQVKNQQKKVVSWEMGEYFLFVQRKWMKVVKDHQDLKANDVQEMVWKMWSRGKVNYATKQKTKKVRDPAEPKKPPSAFFLFQNHIKMELAKKGVTSTSNSKEVKEMMAERWRSLVKEEKQTFLNQVDEKKQKYLKEMEEFKTMNSED